MLINVPEAAALLGVSEKTVYRYLKQGTLPVYRVGEQYRFSRAELLAWATSRRVNVPENLFHESLHCSFPLPTLSQALQDGGIFYRIEGDDKESVLRHLAQHARLDFPVDRDYVFRLMLAREAFGSTSVGDGIAIPQLIYPNSLELGRKSVSLVFLEKPVEFESLDGRPVECLLGVFSSTIRGYYHLTNRIHYALRDRGVREVLGAQGRRDEILGEVSRVEASLAPSVAVR